MLVDTHCHIHQSDYSLPAADVLTRAHEAGIKAMICVGTDQQSSVEAIEFAKKHEGVFATIGVHPHESKHGIDSIAELAKAGSTKLVAIGEIGLDYYYTHSSREVQMAVFEQQLQLAKDAQLPVVFHVRSAFDDFWPIVANFSGIRGVMHSFTDSFASLERALAAGFYVGVNGISTFTRDTEQTETFRRIPLDRLLLETDAPFLTPTPYRGKVNEPSMVSEVAKYHANLRDISYDEIASHTSHNAKILFGI